jgi:hypothetical protein
MQAARQKRAHAAIADNARYATLIMSQATFPTEKAGLVSKGRLLFATLNSGLNLEISRVRVAAPIDAQIQAIGTSPATNKQANIWSDILLIVRNAIKEYHTLMGSMFVDTLCANLLASDIA